MSSTAETVLFLFGLVALGYLAGRTRFLRPEAGEGLSDFAVGVAMPLLLFRTMVQADFSGAAPWRLWAAYFGAVAIAWAAGHAATTALFGRDGATGVVGGVSASFSNTVLLGIPFVLGVYGHDGVEVLSLIVSVHLPVMMMASIVLFQLFGSREGAPEPLPVLARQFLRRLFTNPLIVGILAGLLFRLTGLALPGLAARLVDALAGIAGPLALFAMGLGLVRFGITGTVAPALALTAVKLALMPAAAMALCWLLGLPPLAAKVAVATAALPSGINSYLIATQFRTGQALASNQMTIATLLAVATTAFWLAAAEAAFG